MMAMAAALAPSEPRKAPLMPPPPSYVTSANRLTTPIVNTKRNAEPSSACANFTGAPPCMDSSYERRDEQAGAKLVKSEGFPACIEAGRCEARLGFQARDQRAEHGANLRVGEGRGEGLLRRQQAISHHSP